MTSKITTFNLKIKDSEISFCAATNDIWIFNAY